MIGRSGKRGSGISVPAARHDDDDDDSQKCMPNHNGDTIKTSDTVL